MKKAGILALVILLGGFGEIQGAPATSAEPATGVQRQAVVAAAKGLLQKFWPSLEKERLSYGLAPADSLDTLSFGEPVELRGVRDDSVRAYQPGQSVAKLTEPTRHWYVPLVSQGNFRAMVEVLEQGPGQWHGSGIGWVPLAQKWQALTRRWPATGEAGPVLLIFFSQPGYYVSVPSAQPANLTPLASLTLNPDGSVPSDFRLEEAARVMERLKAAIATQPGS